MRPFFYKLCFQHLDLCGIPPNPPKIVKILPRACAYSRCSLNIPPQLVRPLSRESWKIFTRLFQIQNMHKVFVNMSWLNQSQIKTWLLSLADYKLVFAPNTVHITTNLLLYYFLHYSVIVAYYYMIIVLTIKQAMNWDSCPIYLEIA